MLFLENKNIEKIIENQKKPSKKQKKSTENRRNKKKSLLSTPFSLLSSKAKHYYQYS